MSADQVPIIWNVLRGDMALVGPLPMAPQLATALKNEDRRVLSAKPGITGPWVLLGDARSNMSLAERRRHEILFIERASLADFVNILWRTVVLGCTRSS